ncbi:diguanylate cyclase [Neorhizobium sp. P12A]|uniref:PAS domain-containing protein n=1 Tax=Rhizobium/Agrobacterium group TaxID=227290 RepID=UPI001052094D|nr:MULTISPECIES: PAS domain-containing protein [Rhizobium/Agrobacterium group]KAA0690256.1 diguanylate cyclase [Neorhizobium sp. P12A]TCR69259.1 PAS domain-containing protein [Rhizobium sp. BK376]
MTRDEHAAFVAEIFEGDVPEAGIYTWDIQKNLVFADAALADLFGLDPAETKRGLPLEAYLARVHPDDRPMLAKSISQSIIAESPQQHPYRVRGRHGAYTPVTAFGRAFRDRADTPVLYSGIVIPTASLDRTDTRAH